jgi:hypothetical protein
MSKDDNVEDAANTRASLHNGPIVSWVSNEIGEGVTKAQHAEDQRQP